MPSIVAINFTVNDTLAVALLQQLMIKLEPEGLGVFLSGTIRPYLQERVLARFGSEGDEAVGGPWAALAPSTIANRIALGFESGPIQQRTGELISFFSNDGEIRSTLIGTNLIYPSPTPAGDLYYKLASAQRGNLRTGAPPRPILALDSLDQEFALMQLSNYILGVPL